jgi:hypothetical protein
MKIEKIKHKNMFYHLCIKTYIYYGLHLQHGLYNSFITQKNKFYFKRIGYYYQDKQNGFWLTENKI